MATSCSVAGATSTAGGGAAACVVPRHPVETAAITISRTPPAVRARLACSLIGIRSASSWSGPGTPIHRRPLPLSIWRAELRDIHGRLPETLPRGREDGIEHRGCHGGRAGLADAAGRLRALD